MNQYDEKGMVICQECGKSFNQITYKHLKLHKLTCDDYKLKYPNFPMASRIYSTKQKLKNVKIFDESSPEESIVEEIKIEEAKEFDLDKIPIVSKEFASEVSNFIEEVKLFTEEHKLKFPDPKKLIHKEKLKILDFLLNYFQDLKNSYFIEKYNKAGLLEVKLVTDICIPSKKIDIEFPNAFWHNRDVIKHNRDVILKECGWIIVDVIEPRPTVTDVKNILKKFKLI